MDIGQFFREHGYYPIARYIPMPTREAKQRWENSELKRGHERMVRQHVDRILDGWARERDDQELIAMNGKKRRKCNGRNKRPVLVFDKFEWKLGPLTHWPKSELQQIIDSLNS